MIDELRTAEDILEYVRQQSRVQQSTPDTGNNGTLERRTNTDIDSENGGYSEGTSRTASNFHRRNEPSESDQGRNYYSNDTVRKDVDGVTGNSRGVNQHNERLTAVSSELESPNNASYSTVDPYEDYQSRVVTPPTKKSRFKFFQPYKEVIQEHRKAAQEKKKAPPKKPRHVMTEVETRLKREQLIEVLLWQSEHIDQIVIAITKGHNKMIVFFGDIDHEEAETLADFLLRHAKRNDKMAAIVEQMLDIQERMEVAIIVFPRLWRMIAYILGTGVSLR